MPRVIHTAQALVDAVLEVPALPARGGNVMATSYRRYAGGAVTILLAAARSGAHCVHAGAVGTGPNADLVRAALAAEGIVLSAPPVPDLDTGVCVVLIEPSAERSFVTTQGAERLISVESLAASAPQAGDLVCISGYSLVGRTLAPLVEWLDTLAPDVVVVLDPGATFAELDAPLRDRVLARTDVWTGNAEEAAATSGVAGLDEAPASSRPSCPGCRGDRPRRAAGVRGARGRSGRFTCWATPSGRSTPTVPETPTRASCWPNERRGRRGAARRRARTRRVRSRSRGAVRTRPPRAGRSTRSSTGSSAADPFLPLLLLPLLVLLGHVGRPC